MSTKEKPKTKGGNADKDDNRTPAPRGNNRPPSPSKATVVVTPGNPRGLTPPPDRYSPRTVMVTPELPPPGPMFPAQSTPGHVKNMGKPPTPSRHRRRKEQTRSPRESLKAVRDLVDGPPASPPWSERPDQGSTYSQPYKDRESSVSTRSLRPVQGSVVSRLTRTLVNNEDNVGTPVSSRWTYPRYNIRAPSEHTFRTYPHYPTEAQFRRDKTPKLPRTSWSRVPARGSIIAPPWSEKRLVVDTQLSSTAKWVSQHGAHAAEYSNRPMWLGYDMETDSDILQTPQGPRRYMGQEPEATDTGRWLERNFGESRDWLDTPYHDGRYYQYDRRYLDVDQYSDYVPDRDYYPTNPVLYNDKAESTSRWVNKNLEPDPILLARERRRHRHYEPGRGHPPRNIPIHSLDGIEPQSHHQRYREPRYALPERETYRHPVRPEVPVTYRRRPPDSVRPMRGSESRRRTPEFDKISPDKYDRYGDDASYFSRQSKVSYNGHIHRQPRPQSDWDRYKDYGANVEALGPPSMPGRENVERWLARG